jgi:hypothetical protein
VATGLASKDGRKFAPFFGAETGTVFGTVSLGDPESPEGKVKKSNEINGRGNKI